MKNSPEEYNPVERALSSGQANQEITKVATLYHEGGQVLRWCWVNFQCQGVLLTLIRVGQGPAALAVGCRWGLFGHFVLSSIISFFILPLSGRQPDID